MATYASKTTVSQEKSRQEIERTIARFGADRFAYGFDRNRGEAYVAFTYQERAIKITLELPDPNSFDRTPTRRSKRSQKAKEQAHEQACREAFRALAIMIKGKLAGIEQNVSTFEKEFLPYTILPDGQTVSDWLEPQIQRLLQTGQMPTQLAITGSQK